MKKLFNPKSSSPQKAFTLIELLVVIAVLSILAIALIAAINPIQKINNAKDSTLKSDMSQLANALQVYYTNQATPAYPTALTVSSFVGSSGELKVTPKQQVNTGCTSINPAGTNGDAAGEEYCYAVTGSGDAAAVWGRMFATSTIFYCWDSTNGVFRSTSTSQPGATALCP